MSTAGPVRHAWCVLLKSSPRATPGVTFIGVLAASGGRGCSSGQCSEQHCDDNERVLAALM
jgi:hypothetical protein